MNFWEHPWGLILLHKQGILDISIVVTAFAVGATFILAMFVEIPKRRRTMKVLSYKLERHTQSQLPAGETERVIKNWTQMEITFSNGCQRPIKIMDVKAYSYGGVESDNCWGYDNTELKEGDDRIGTVTFSSDWIEDKDLKKIVIFDSMEKRHKFYYYKGILRSRWKIWVLSFLDWYFKMLHL